MLVMSVLSVASGVLAVLAMCGGALSVSLLAGGVPVEFVACGGGEVNDTWLALPSLLRFATVNKLGVKAPVAGFW